MKKLLIGFVTVVGTLTLISSAFYLASMLIAVICYAIWPALDNWWASRFDFGAILLTFILAGLSIILIVYKIGESVLNENNNAKP